MRRSTKSLMLLAACAAFAPAFTQESQAVPVMSTWNGNTNSWQNAAQWTNVPNNGLFPNNGADTYSVTLGAGQATLNAGVTIDNLTLTGGAIDLNNNDLNVNQTLDWTGGTVFGPGSLMADMIQISGAANKFLSNSFLVNDNTATLDGTGSLVGLAGAQIQNNLGGSFDIVSDASILNGGGAFDYINKGKFRKVSGNGNSNVEAIVDNTGSVEARSGTLTLTNAPVQLSGSTLTGGTWIAAGGGQLVIAGAALDTIGAGTVVMLENAGSKIAAVETVSDNQGEIHIRSGAELAVTAPTLTNQNLIKIENGKLTTKALTNTGNLLVEAPSVLIVDGTLLNSGLLVVDGMVQGTGPVTNNGQLRGSGQIEPDVLNANLLAPGPDVGGTGILTLANDLELTPASILEIEIGGLTPGTEHDQLVVQGNALLGGTLQVLALPGLTIQPGDIFTILTANSITGSFAQMLLPTNGQNQPLFDLVVNADSVQLVVRDRQPPGDPTGIPEPASLVLTLVGSLGLARRRQRA